MRRESTVTELNKRKANLIAEREDWLPRWRRIQEVVAPIFGYFHDTDRQGRRKWGSLYNDTPLFAVQVLSAGLQSGLTSPNNQWFHLTDADPAINEDYAVRKYCMDCEEIMSADMLSCGIYDAYAGTYNNLGPFGTGGFLLLEDTKQPFICVPLEIGEYCIGMDYRRQLNEFFRTVELTPSQMAEQFGKERLPETVRRAFETDQRVKFKVHHLIAPNDGRIEGERGLKGFAYLSFYWLDESEKPLTVGGYNEFPFIGGRWYQIGQDVYGYGPGEMAFGNSAQLQAMEKDMTTARQLLLQPPIQIPSTIADKVSLLPGSKIYYDPTGADAPIKPVLAAGLDVRGTMEGIMLVEERIKRAFFTQLFMAILDRADQNPQKTATEIQEIIAEKSSMIGPVLQRLDREVLRPSINRVYAIEARAGRLPEPPEQLVGRELSIEYTSPLMLALKAKKTTSIDRFLQFFSGVASAKPEILDIINGDKMARLYANYLDVPSECINTEEETEQIRQARARAQNEAQQREEALQMAQIAPGALKTMSETSIGPGNLLGDITGMGG